MNTIPDDHGERFAADALTAALCAARARIPTDCGEDVTVELHFESWGTPRSGEYNPYTSVDGTLEIDDDDPVIECWIRLSPAWFAATHRYGAILIDGLFPMSFDDWDGRCRPTRITAIRPIPEALIPPDQGHGWEIGVSDAQVTWDDLGVPHARWAIGDNSVHEYADENGRRTGHPPVRNIYDWNDTEAIAIHERQQAEDAAWSARHRH